MFARHKWFTFYSFVIGLIADAVALIVSLVTKSSDAIFITSLIVTLIYLFMVISFLNTGVRKRYYNKDDKNVNDYRNILLVSFGLQVLIFIVVVICALCIK